MCIVKRRDVVNNLGESLKLVGLKPCLILREADHVNSLQLTQARARRSAASSCDATSAVRKFFTLSIRRAASTRSSGLQVAYRTSGLVIVFVECVCEHFNERQVRPRFACCPH